MRSKLLDKKTKSRIVKMSVMAGYVALYYITRHIAGIQAAEKLQGLAKLLEMVNGG